MTFASLMGKPKWLTQSLADIARHEGFREFAYPDPLSKLAKVKAKWGFEPAEVIIARLGLNPTDGAPWTVGHGFTRGVTFKHRISLEQSLKLLEKEIIVHNAVLDKIIPEWKAMPVHVQTVLVNMAFNMGNRLAQFKPTLALFKAGNYAAAGTRLQGSLWYKQVGGRAKELVERLKTGKIQDKYKVI